MSIAHFINDNVKRIFGTLWGKLRLCVVVVVFATHTRDDMLHPHKIDRKGLQAEISRSSSDFISQVLLDEAWAVIEESSQNLEQILTQDGSITSSFEFIMPEDAQIHPELVRKCLGAGRDSQVGCMKASQIIRSS